jgi:hypothetical protein
MSNSSSIVIDYSEWNTEKTKYMAPKTNEKGGSSINIISTQSNRVLQITTPMMTTWGISDYIDPKTGESDGKFSISLVFPNEEYATQETADFLEKMKAFENQIISDAVKHSNVWWRGPTKSREVLEFTHFPSLKYSKNNETQEIDYSRAPSLRAKVPFYSNKWGIDIYDVNSVQIFPSESSVGRTPCDFVSKMSSVACVLQCGGIWIGGKGWGVTWKCIQCVVKPRENMSVLGSGKCFVKIPKEMMTAPAPVAKAAAAPRVAAAAPVSDKISSVIVEDSDDEEAPAPAPAPTPEVPAPVEVVAVAAVADVPAAVADVPAAVEVVPAAAADVPAVAAPKTVIKKTVIKKKVV